VQQALYALLHRDLSCRLIRLDRTRVFRIDDGDATIGNVVDRHQTGQVVRAPRKVLQFLVRSFKGHCNRYDRIVAAARRGTWGPGHDRELRDARGTGDLLYLDHQGWDLGFFRDPLAVFQELAFDLRGVALHLFEPGDIMLQVRQLGLLLGALLRPLVEAVQEGAEQQEVITDDEEQDDQEAEDQDVPVAAVH
jgi:hypothetical protein